MNPENHVRLAGNYPIVDYRFDRARDGEAALDGLALTKGYYFESDPLNPEVGPHVEFSTEYNRGIGVNLKVRLEGKPDFRRAIEEGIRAGREAQQSVIDELAGLPDSAFEFGHENVHGGETIRVGGEILTCVGWADRNVYDDRNDCWIRRRSPGFRPASPEEIARAGFLN